MRERRRPAEHPADVRESLEYLGKDLLVSDDETGREIIDLGSRTYTRVDKRTGTYWAMTLDDWFAFNVAIGKSGERLRKRSDAEAPDETPFTFSATGRSERIAGHPVNEYAARGGRKTGTVWIADDIAPPAAVTRYGRLAAAHGMDLMASPLAWSIPGHEGLALAGSLRYEGQTVRWETIREVTELREEPAPHELVDLPAGLRRVPPPTVPSIPDE